MPWLAHRPLTHATYAHSTTCQWVRLTVDTPVRSSLSIHAMGAEDKEQDVSGRAKLFYEFYFRSNKKLAGKEYWSESVKFILFQNAYLVL